MLYRTLSQLVPRVGLANISRMQELMPRSTTQKRDVRPAVLALIRHLRHQLCAPFALLANISRMQALISRSTTQKRDVPRVHQEVTSLMLEQMLLCTLLVS